MQRSTTQLVRSVEGLESRLDASLVELRRDLARLDVGQDTLQTAVSAVSDEQKQLPALRRTVRRHDHSERWWSEGEQMQSCLCWSEMK